MPPSESLGLPLKVFLYTLDQIADMLEINVSASSPYIHWDRRSVGIPPKDRMVARNIAPQGKHPDWRIADMELRRWLKYRGFRIYERGYVGK